MVSWRQVAAILVLMGGFADASLAHPDRMASVDVVLFATGLASTLLFLSLDAVTRWRLLLVGAVGLVSAVAVVVDAAEGVTRIETVLAACDIVARLGLAACLAALAHRHLRPRASRGLA